MATKASTIEYIEDQLTGLDCSTRKMFGEYAVYCDGKVVALVCDDTLFVKSTDVGKVYVGKRYREGVAYPGAKPSMRIDDDLVEDREWLQQLIRITADELPAPKPKKKRSSK